MHNPKLDAEKMGALFLLGVLIFSPPIIGIFDAGADATVFDIPLLYFYLFCAWAALIGVAAWVITGQPRRNKTSSLFSQDDGPGDG